VLHQLYTDFKADISSRGMAYEGMAYRAVAEDLGKKDFNGFAQRRYVFAGFNALNKCEERLFGYLTDSKNADFYWDFDEYYVQDPINEAGQFMRNNLTRFGFTNKDMDHANLLKPKNIKLIASPTGTGQAKLTTSILEQLSAVSDNYTDTAVVLVDENLLMPVLYSLPETVKAANVTMGYPLKITPTYSFIDSLLEMQKAEKNGRFYHKTVLAVLNHQFVANRFGAEAEKIITEAVQFNRIYLSPASLATNELFKMLFEIPQNHELPAYLQRIILQLSAYFKEDQNDQSPFLLELESLFKAYTELNRIGDVLGEDAALIGERKTYIRIVRKVLGGVSVSFAGEPLSGLQVLGVLETRLVDFKNVIILSLNEGLFPTGKPSPSFIPYNIRTGFGIPTVKHQDAIFCYYFYRLLHRAENVWLAYSTQTSDNSKGEMSRYVSQLLFSGRFKIEQQQAEFSVYPQRSGPISIAKDPEVKKLLAQYIKGWGDRRLSPSAINAYIDCPLRFYFRYIARINEPDELTELLNEAQFGLLYHKSMEQLFSNKIGRELSPDDLRDMAADTVATEQALLHAFGIEIFKGKTELTLEDITGYNSVVFSILKKYIANLLRLDAKYAPLTVHYLEHQMSLDFPVASNGKTLQVQLYGNADRIDETRTEMRIIDYKTGSVNTDIRDGLPVLFQGAPKRNSAALQTILYTMAYSKTIDAPRPAAPAVFSIRNQSEKSRYHLQICEARNRTPITDYRAIADEFEELLANCLSTLFDPELPFIQTEHIENCQYCSYRSVCCK